jgi:DNA-binding CsgD family transcriptional regulator
MVALSGTKPLLPSRQQDVIGLVAYGRTTRDIALILGIGQSTVKWHLGRLMRRYGVNSRSALVVAAIARGELDPHASLASATRRAVQHRPRLGKGGTNC